MKSELATIIVNGKPRRLLLPCSAGEFIEQCGWRRTQVVVERNGRVLERGNLNHVALADGDTIEVIVPVAGG